MKTRRTRALVTAVLTVAISSCAAPAGRLALPEASAVGQVVISRSGTIDEPERERVIDDRKAVDRFLAFLRARNDGWHKLRTTSPTPRYTVSLERDKELLLAVYLGPNWIGGRRGGKDSWEGYRSLSNREQAELLDILSIPKN